MRPDRSVVEFEIPGRPVPKARPRVGARGAKNPKSTREYQRAAGWLAQSKMRGEPWPGPVAVEVHAYYARPKTRTGDRWPHGIPADLDNVVKMALDICNGTVYVDDRQVCQLTALKGYSSRPRLYVRVRRIDG